MLLTAGFPSSSASFFLASVAGLARTRTKLGARVDACKWNGRGRRQNSGKLKLMNNRSPCSPVCSPSELSYASQRRNRWKTVEEQRGMWLRWKRRYNDDTAGRGARGEGAKGSRSFSFFLLAILLVLRGLRDLFRILLQATNAFLMSSPAKGFCSLMNYADAVWRDRETPRTVANCLGISLVSVRIRLNTSVSCLLIYSRPILARRLGHSRYRGLRSTVAISYRRAPSDASTKVPWNWSAVNKKSS